MIKIANKRHNGVFFTIITSLVLTVSNPKAHAANGPFGTTTRGEINLWVESLIILLFIGILAINFMRSKKMGQSILSVPFTYIIAGLIVMESARIMILFYELNIYTIEETTLQLGWHYLFFLGIILFLLSIRQFSIRLAERELFRLTTSDYSIFSIIGVLAILGFLFLGSLGTTVNKSFQSSAFDTSGSIHFVAFAITVILVLMMIRVRSKSKSNDMGHYINGLFPSFFVFLLLMSLIHLWELLTESWSVLVIDEEIIESGEQLFWVLGNLIMVYGFYNLYKIASKTLAETESGLDSTKLDMADPVVASVIQVLSNHIGSLSVSIAQKSSSESGINLADLNDENVNEFALAVANNTKDLIGDFPSKFLKKAIQRQIRLK